MVLAAITLVVTAGGGPVSAQVARGSDSGTSYSLSEKARRDELERKAREAAIAAENAVDAKAREEAQREKRIAEIELDVLRAAERRGTPAPSATEKVIAEPQGQTLAQTIVRPAAPEQREPQTDTVREPSRAQTKAEARRKKEEQRLAAEREKSARIEADLEKTKQDLVNQLKNGGTAVTVKTPAESPVATPAASSNPADPKARVRALLDQKLDELKSPSAFAPRSASATAATPTTPAPVAASATANPAARTEVPASDAAPATAAVSTPPASTVVRPIALPTVQELEAEARARREREREAADQARQRVHESEIKRANAAALETATAIAAPANPAPTPAPAQIIATPAAAERPVSSPPAVAVAAAQAQSAPPTTPTINLDDAALRRLADEAEAAEIKARAAREAAEKNMQQAPSKPSVSPEQLAKERAKEEARVKAQMEARMKEEARQREKAEKARAKELKRAAEKAPVAPAAPASTAPKTIVTRPASPAPAAPTPAVSSAPATPATPAPAPAAPATPPALAGSREEKLKQLLEAYRTGAINASDYHRERARVLSQ